MLVDFVDFLRPALGLPSSCNRSWQLAVITSPKEAQASPTSNQVEKMSLLFLLSPSKSFHGKYTDTATNMERTTDPKKTETSGAVELPMAPEGETSLPPPPPPPVVGAPGIAFGDDAIGEGAATRTIQEALQIC
ncbi:hypothetical protein Leryth_026586 [Lithospermum erythrorhizon]|nr:hypothetical protein Leryth_026586 [Lithospermum erythrorhizon]